MKERRRFERYRLTLETRVKASDGGNRDRNTDVQTSNISAGGAYLKTPKPLPQGMEVRMEIILPFNNLKKVRVDKDACLTITGRVVRSDASGAAVQFNDDCMIVPVN